MLLLKVSWTGFIDNMQKHSNGRKKKTFILLLKSIVPNALILLSFGTVWGVFNTIICDV